MHCICIKSALQGDAVDIGLSQALSVFLWLRDQSFWVLFECNKYLANVGKYVNDFLVVEHSGLSRNQMKL